MSLKTVDIKGKEYVMVNERIMYFRTAEEYKGYRMDTEIISLEDGVCVMRATVKNTDGIVVSTGHAYEKEGSTYINKTSYIENCETSAIGRCLGNLGIGIDTSVASYEEVANAIKQQGDLLDVPAKSFQQRLNDADAKYQEAGKSFANALVQAGYTDIDEAYTVHDAEEQKRILASLRKTFKEEKRHEQADFAIGQILEANDC